MGQKLCVARAYREAGSRLGTPAPMPSLGDVARERRESKTSDEKPDVVIKQDAKGKPVVVTK